jgi:sugar lactone lactonase YvrE
VSQIEDVLRRAYAEAAQTVMWGDIASTVPGLEETRPARRARRRRLTIPVLAAAATAVVAIVVAIVPALLAHGPAQSPAASLRSGHGAPLGLQAPGGFFAALPPGGQVQIRSALTGRLIAAVTPPGQGEFFSGVAATGADGRTLLLAVEHDTGAPCRTRLFQLRLTASGEPGPLTPADIPAIPGILPNRAFAATPDGSAIAFAAYCQGSNTLEIDRPHTGASAGWVTTRGDQIDNISLSSDGATLSLSGYEYAGTGPGAKKGTSSARLRPATAVLHASSANTSLDGLGIVARKIGTAALSPDGRTLYVCTHQGRLAVLAAYDVATKARRRTLATWAGGCSFALDTAGQYALIATAAGGLSRLDIGTGRLTTLLVSGIPSSAILAW